VRGEKRRSEERRLIKNLSIRKNNNKQKGEKYFQQLGIAGKPLRKGKKIHCGEAFKRHAEKRETLDSSLG